FFMALLDHLAARGLPVPPAIRDRDGAAIQTLEGRPACLIRFLPGVSVTRPTPAQARTAGAALADLHAAVADFDGKRANSLGVAAWRPLLERCGADLDDIAPGLFARVDSALAAVEADWPRDLPACVIHAALFPDNVLMLAARVTGLIDFYFACTDLRAYDVAVMHTSWGFDPAGAPLDGVGSASMEGYGARLSAAERAAL
ncbi:phosphotransferase, partial [Escherichia coli]|nr:phosphotransferase [Escherichia coli]